MSWGNRSTIVVIGGLCLVFIALARWAREPSPGEEPALKSIEGLSEPGVATVSGPGSIAASLARATLSAQKARDTAIREATASIQAECQRAAGGDWNLWSQKLSSVRADLLKQIQAAKPYNPGAKGYFEARSPVLEGRDKFPLFESAPEFYLTHVVEPKSLDPFRTERAVVSATRWLKQQGIDVIFVAVPKMTEVYPEYFTGHCPGDRVIAPHVRQTLLELLEADVEVVDLLPAFLEARDKDPELLYQPADPHWSPRAQAIAARLVAARLKRYEFVAKARASRPICTMADAPYPPASGGAAYEALNPEQRRRAEENHPRSHRIPTSFTVPQFDDHAPVACIGDSYNGGFVELLGAELNLSVRGLAGGGNTTDAFKDFLRSPELLKGSRIVIWLVCNTSLRNPWPLHQQIRETLNTADREGITAR